MKITPKPLTTVKRPAMKTSAMKALVTLPKERVVTRAYQQLVTVQNVAPDRAKALLDVP